jgi:tetratricopeptide (TPR) repeat protein
MTPDEGYRKAHDAALKAIAIDSTLAEAHTAMGDVHCARSEFADAEREFRLAIQLNPGLADAHNRHAWCLIKLGRADDAIREARRALELDPLNASLYNAIGSAYLHARRYREGVDALEPVRALQPDQSATHGWRSQLLAEVPDGSAAIRECTMAMELSPGASLWLAACASVFARVGQVDSARALLRKPERDSLPPNYWIAQTYAALGDRERAFAWLNRAVEERSGWATEMTGPMWDALRDDSRYVAIARKLGLPMDR